MMQLSASMLCLFVLVAGESLPVQSLVARNFDDGISRSQEKCPTVTVSCPTEVKEGAAIPFIAIVNGGDSSVVPSYKWEVSTGRIIEGQGTASIKLDMTGFGGHSPTATVTISGYDSACARTASCSILQEPPPPPAVLFDRYYPKSIVTPDVKKLRARRRVIRRH